MFASGGVQANFWNPHQLYEKTAFGGVRANMKESDDNQFRHGKWRASGQNIGWAAAARKFGKGSPKLRQLQELKMQLHECILSAIWVRNDYDGTNKDKMVERISAFDWDELE